MKSMMRIFVFGALMMSATAGQAEWSARACQTQKEVLMNYHREIKSGDFSILTDLLFSRDCKSVADKEDQHALCFEILLNTYKQSCSN